MPEYYRYYVPAIRDLATRNRQRKAITGVGLTPQQLGGVATGAIRGASQTAAAVNLQERQFAETKRAQKKSERIAEQERKDRKKAATVSGVTQLAQLGTNYYLTKEFLASRAAPAVGTAAAPAVEAATVSGGTAGGTAAVTAGGGTAGASGGKVAATSGGTAAALGVSAVGGIAGARFAKQQGADEQGQLFAAMLAGGATGAAYGAYAGPYGVAGGAAVGAVVGAAGYLVSDSGGTVLCTELYRQGRMSTDLYVVDSIFGMCNVPKKTLFGYQRWGKPLAKAMSKSKLLTALLAPFIRAWAGDMASRINPYYKSNILGRAMMRLGFPVCSWLGREK